MPYEVQQGPGLGAIGLISGIIAGNRAKHQQDEDRKRKQQQDAINNSYLQAQTNEMNQRSQQAQRDADQQAANRKFETGLQYPKNWGRMSDQDKISYLQVRQNAAQRAGDSDLVTQTQNEINNIALGTYRETQSDYIKGPKSQDTTSHAGLNNALAQKARDWRVVTEEGYKTQLAKANVQAQAAAQRAVTAAGAALQRQQMSDDARLYISYMTGQRVLQGQQFQEALRSSLAQYQTQSQAYITNLRAQDQGKTVTGFDQSQTPTFNFTMPSAPSAPQVIVIPVQQPDGTIKPVVVPQNSGTKPPVKVRSTSSTKPHASAPAQSPHNSGVEWYNPLTWFGHGGGSDPQVEQIVNTAKSIPKASRLSLLMSSSAFKSLTPAQQTQAKSQVQALP